MSNVNVVLQSSAWLSSVRTKNSRNLEAGAPDIATMNNAFPGTGQLQRPAAGLERVDTAFSVQPASECDRQSRKTVVPSPHVPSLDPQLAALQAKLDDTVELLHLWKNEAHAYRLLAEAVAIGQSEPAQAKRALATAVFGPDELRLTYLPLSEGEHRAFAAIAAFAQLAPHELLWACVDTIMAHGDDEDVIAGCAEAARRRFQDGEMPEWGK